MESSSPHCSLCTIQPDATLSNEHVSYQWIEDASAIKLHLIPDAIDSLHHYLPIHKDTV